MLALAQFFHAAQFDFRHPGCRVRHVGIHVGIHGGVIDQHGAVHDKLVQALGRRFLANFAAWVFVAHGQSLLDHMRLLFFNGLQRLAVVFDSSLFPDDY